MKQTSRSGLPFRELQRAVNRRTAISTCNPQRFRAASREEANEHYSEWTKSGFGKRGTPKFLAAGVRAACTFCGQAYQTAHIHKNPSKCRTCRRLRKLTGRGFVCKCGGDPTYIVEFPKELLPIVLDTRSGYGAYKFQCNICRRTFCRWDIFGCLCAMEFVESHGTSGGKHVALTYCRVCCFKDLKPAEPQKADTGQKDQRPVNWLDQSEVYTYAVQVGRPQVDAEELRRPRRRAPHVRPQRNANAGVHLRHDLPYLDDDPERN